jgi:MFS family permease
MIRRARLRESPLRRPARGRIWLYGFGQWLSMIGDATAYTALAWWSAVLHHSPALLGWISAAEGIPMALVFLVGGWLADRFGPLRLIVVADMLRLTTMALIGYAFAIGSTDVTVLAPLFAVIGVGAGLYYPASGAAVPLVAAGALAQGNRVLALAERSSSLLGPGLAAIAVSAVAMPAVFYINSASYLASALTAAWILGGGVSRRAAVAKERFRPTQAGMAFRTIMRSPVRWLIALSLFGSAACNSILSVGVPSYSGSLNGSPAVLSSLLVAYGIGSILGTVISTGVRIRPTLLVPGSIALVGALFGALATTRSLPLAILLLLLIGVLWGTETVWYRTLLQRAATTQAMARTVAVSSLASMGGGAVWQAIAGQIGAAGGPRALLLSMGGIAVAAGLLTMKAVDARRPRMTLGDSR